MADLALLRPSQVLQAVRPELRLGTYFVQTWGCQMNEEDSEQIGLSMQALGLEPAGSAFEAQVVLLNTCSVRKKPEDKAFSLLGELAELKLAQPERIVGVCGCMAQIRANEIHRRVPLVDFVVGTGHLEAVAELVEATLARRSFETRLDLPERKGPVVTDLPQRRLDRATKLKAFVPIQYGCDKFCSFCVVPATRGRERSRSTHDILAEVEGLASLGTREVTLLGQTVNSYGRHLAEGRVPFSELLWRVAEVRGLQRIRFTSPYPRDFTPDLIAAIRDCPKVMEHVHLPLQSGDDDVLRAMKRQYSVAGFLDVVQALREAVPGIALTTDIIVGFPGETDEQFEHTLDVLKHVRFDSAFMFAYSPRPHTPAAEMEQVPAAARKARLARLIELQNAISCQVNEGLVGKEFEVLVEGRSPKGAATLQGYSREFKMMHFTGDSGLVGKLVTVRANESHLWGLRGEAFA